MYKTLRREKTHQMPGKREGNFDNVITNLENYPEAYQNSYRYSVQMLLQVLSKAILRIGKNSLNLGKH